LTSFIGGPVTLGGKFGCSDAKECESCVSCGKKCDVVHFIYGGGE